ncbi:MAG: zinc-binding dehydrogenase [Gammaproteobacteria bacterium]|nr:zinc-binding dehydrogenase [Gammaproteobacteria bacterium]
MKAIVIPRTGDAEVLEYRDVGPPAVNPGHLLVQVAAVGVGFGDVMMRRGLYPHMPPLPFIAGYEAAGVVTEVGAGVGRDWVGRRVVVVTPGGCSAEYVACPVPFAARVPDDVSLESAAALGVNYLTAYYLLKRAAVVAPGDRIVVYAAAGGVGSALVQMGKLAQLEVIALAGTEPKCAFARAEGADHAVSSGTGTVCEAVRAITGDAGVDVVFNSVGGDTLGEDLKMLGPFGQLVLYGMAGGPPAPHFLGQFLQRFEASPSLRLMSLESVAAGDPAAMGSALQELVDLTAAGKISPRIHARLPLEQAAAAHRLLESRQVLGKVVLTTNA